MLSDVKDNVSDRSCHAVAGLAGLAGVVPPPPPAAAHPAVRGDGGRAVQLHRHQQDPPLLQPQQAPAPHRDRGVPRQPPQPEDRGQQGWSPGRQRERLRLMC